jgi:hypothetical protein
MLRFGSCFTEEDSLGGVLWALDNTSLVLTGLSDLSVQIQHKKILEFLSFYSPFSLIALFIVIVHLILVDVKEQLGAILF